MPEISRRQFVVYLLVVVAVVLLGGRALRANGDPTAAPSDGAEGRFTALAGASGRGSTGASGPDGPEVETAAERLLVHVAGAVRRPGVYELEAGARVQDAVQRAGGGRAGAALDALNLAAKVTDGQQVLVARRGAAARTGGVAAGSATSAGGASAAVPGATAPGAAASGAASGAGLAPGATVNVNQADATQLEVLNGVGPAIATKIVVWRTQNGPFKTVDDLALVPGIGPKKLEAMRAQVTT